MLRNCVEASDGNVGTENANVTVRFESMAEGEESGGGANSSGSEAPGLLDQFDLSSILGGGDSSILAVSGDLARERGLSRE